MSTYAVKTSDSTRAKYEPLDTGVSRLAAEPLVQEHTAEVLAFLVERPVHTVIMSGWIRDNGLVSPLNRGTFYAYRNGSGQLEGVALIGHITLVEARTDRALKAFVWIAQQYSDAHLLMGEQERIKGFWDNYSGEGQPIRRACRETLLELRQPVATDGRVPDVRLATLDDLHLIMPAQAQMAFEESGVDPREADPEGFRIRCARRIEQGRVWVLIEDGKLIFKADIIGHTPEVFYLEGVYVSPQLRGQGFGTLCMSHLSNHLLAQTQSICLLVNEHNVEAQALYKKVGYQPRGCYDTVFLKKKAERVMRDEARAQSSPMARPLTESDKPEVLDFLALRQVQTVILAGWIHDHGIERPHNLGTFYGYWDSRGELKGVALIGRMTLFETRSDAATLAFAELARQASAIRMVMGESEGLEKFWRRYADVEQKPRLRSQEVLYECDRPAHTARAATKLRRATPDDLDRVVTAHAEMVIEETRVDPLKTDPERFRGSCARRIEQGRVWVIIKDGELLFKADLITETPGSAYLEGLWVNPAHRRKGYGESSFAELSRALLTQKTSFSGFVNAENLAAQTFYEKAGCKVRARFDKIYI